MTVFPQDPTAKNRKLQKEKQKTEVDETGEKSVNPAGSSQVDEYDQDTSDEEVSCLVCLFTTITIRLVLIVRGLFTLLQDGSFQETCVKPSLALH